MSWVVRIGGVLLITVLSLQVATGVVSERELRATILKGYDKFARPRTDPTQSIRVNVSFTLMKLLDLTDREQVMSVIGFFTFSWMDDYIKWDRATTGIKSMALPATEVWTPDIAMRDSESPPFDVTRNTNDFVEAFPSGNVLAYPIGELQLLCPINIRYFPFDEHICAVSMGNWMLTSAKQQLFPVGEVALRKIAAHIQWSISGTSTQRYCYNYGVDEYDMIRIYFKLERKSNYYVVNFIVPIYLLAILSITDFIVPLDHGGRINTSMVILLTYVVFQLVLFRIMPQTSDVTPLLSVLIFIQMGLLVVSIVMDATLQWMKRRDPKDDNNYTELPNGSYDSTTIGSFCTFCCLKETKTTEPEDMIICFRGCHSKARLNKGEVEPEGGVETEKQPKGSKTWFDYAMKVDRYFMMIYILILIMVNALVLIAFAAKPEKILPHDGKCPGFQWDAGTTLGETQTLDDSYQFN